MERRRDWAREGALVVGLAAIPAVVVFLWVKANALAILFPARGPYVNPVKPAWIVQVESELLLPFEASVAMTAVVVVFGLAIAGRGWWRGLKEDAIQACESGLTMIYAGVLVSPLLLFALLALSA